MKNKILYIGLVFGIIFLFIGTNIISSFALELKKKSIVLHANNSWLYVGGSGPENYTSIQCAIDDAENGFMIFVYNGVYNESIIINKSLNIIGENKIYTIIDGLYNNYVVNFLADNICIKNFTIRNSGGYYEDSGIKINSNNNTIASCIIYRAKSGIFINQSNNIELSNCTFHTNGEGLYIKSSIDIRVFDSVFNHNAFGLNIYNSTNVQLYNCYINISSIGILTKKSSFIRVNNCAIFNNNDNGGGNFIDSSNDVIFLNCNINHNGFGINIQNSSVIKVENCDLIFNEHCAIRIKDKSKNVIIENCEITNNFRFAIDISDSRCKIRNCNFHKNLFGIYAQKSFCDACYNWWGLPFGPSFFEKKIRDNIKPKLGLIFFIPWRLFKNKEVGSNWEIDYNKFFIQYDPSRYNQIKLNGTDSDNDLVPDWWEDKWGYDKYIWDNHEILDPDGDGLNNIEECYTDYWDSDPFKKDIFIEFDWMTVDNPSNLPNKPSSKYIDMMIDVFNKHNINIHLDDGILGGGEEVPFKANLTFVDIRDYYWDYFLHNDLNNPRKGIFRYCFICDYGPESGVPGYSNFGWDNLDSIEISSERVHRNHPNKEKAYIIISITMHELGHTMGLFVDDHGGIDNKIATMLFTKELFKYFRYKSIMNYQFTYSIFDYSDGTRGRYDFDDWDNLDFKFFKNTSFELLTN